MNSKNSILRMVVFATCLAPIGAMANKKATAAAPAVPAPAAAAQPEGVNPMTGKPLSEEALMRSLSRARLQTQLEQESLKLAQTRGELALSAVRLDVEKNKLTGGGAFNAGPIPAGRPPAPQGRSPAPAIPPLVSGLPQDSGFGAQGSAAPMPVRVMPEIRPTGPASGGIEFGGVRIAAVSGLPPAQSRVEYVDVHAAGAPAKGGGGGGGRPQISSGVMPAAPASR
jgi:hypothetical protein